MKVTVKYIGFQPLQELRKTAMEIPEGFTLQDLMEKIKESRPPNEKKLLDRATLLVNREKGDLEGTLKEGDYVLILVPLGGG